MQVQEKRRETLVTRSSHEARQSTARENHFLVQCLDHRHITHASLDIAKNYLAGARFKF